MKTRFKFTGSRGSALVTVLLFTFLIVALVNSVLLWSVQERTMTERESHWLEARNAAEGVAEYALGQVAILYKTKANPPSLTGANVLSTPPASFWTGTDVDPTSIEVFASTPTLVNPGGEYNISNANENNQYDPESGQWVYRQDIQVFAKATVNPPEGGLPITSYVTETLSVRGAPLFANAIFYSSTDLELFPGPTMSVVGPVHSNGNIFVSSQGSSLTFSGGAVSAAGNIFHAWSNTNASAEGAGSETIGQSPVYFSNMAGTTHNMDVSGTAAGWDDSTMGADNGITGATAVTNLITSTVTTNFAAESASLWGGYVQTGPANGVEPYNPIALNEVIGPSNELADPHSIIDPPNPPASTDVYYTAKEEVENNKISTAASLYVQVVVQPGVAGQPASVVAPPNGAPAAIQIYGDPNSTPAGTPTTQIGPNGGLLLNLPTNTSHPLVTFVPFQKVKVASYARFPATGTQTGWTVTGTYTNSAGNSSANTYSQVIPITNDAFVTGGTATTPTTTGGNLVTGGTSVAPTVGSTYVISGLIDQRRLQDGSSNDGPAGIDLVQVDMVAVTNAVTNMTTGTNNSSSITQGVSTLWTGWNGAIYVDVENKALPAADLFPTVASTNDPLVTPTGANITPAMQPASVSLVNGTVTSGNSLIPTAAANLYTYPGSAQENIYGNGLTIATNVPVYVIGNFNADGTINANSNTTPDDGHTDLPGTTVSAESPVAIDADAVTLLSPGWSNANSTTNDPGASGSIEIAAALLTGVTPTGTTSESGATQFSSGGAHNLPRFLESFSGITVAMRGALTTLYQSRYATQPWSTNYYGPPNRQWGFDQIFANGKYPPLAPKSLSVRRVGYSDNLTPSQYQSFKTTYGG